MITLSHPIKLALILLLSSVLSACASWGHLNYKQARMLKKEGFVLTDEGWSLRLPQMNLKKSHQKIAITAEVSP